MSTPAISVQNLSKLFRVGVRHESDGTLLSVLANAIKAPIRNFHEITRLGKVPPAVEIGDKGPTDAFWALKDVNFELQQGEILGVIGANGAGKSTLLKILSRITHPTIGRVVCQGRVGSLLEVGTGFHPDLTGRENVFLNGTILGMKKKEIEAAFEMIVDFSGVSKFIDTPVKRYSSGMRVRLAFAVAAYLNPEILIIDEVLAVGDAEFQRQCLGRMEQIANQGRTVIFVSHNMGAVTRLCTRAIALKSGRIAMDGLPADVIAAYLKGKESADAEQGGADVDLGLILIKGVRAIQDGNITRSPKCEECLAIEIAFVVKSEIERLLIGFELVDSEGNIIFRSYDESKYGLGVRQVGIYKTTGLIPANILQPRTHYLRLVAGIHREKWLGRNLYNLALDFHAEKRNDIDHIGVIKPLVEWNIVKHD